MRTYLCVAALAGMLALVSRPGPALAGPPTLVSHPAHAEFVLVGDATISGQSPLIVEEPLRGSYTLMARKDGYENQRIKLEFPDGGGPVHPFHGSGNLGSLGRTLLLPGAAQWEQGTGSYGTSMVLAELAGVSLLMKSQFQANDARRSRETSEALLYRGDPSSLTPDQQRALQGQIYSSSLREDDARRARKAWLLYSGAVWGFGVADLALLRGSLDVRSRGLDTLEVRLSPLTRGGAVVRSALIPGSGQVYAGHTGRGAWMMFLTSAAVGVALVGEQHLDRTLSDQLVAQHHYDLLGTSGASPEQLNAAVQDVQNKASTAGNARRTRNVLWGAAGAAWVLNVLDAGMMDLPSPATLFSTQPAQPGMFAHFQPDQVRLGYRRGF